MPFKRYVSVGAVVLCNFGEDYGKLFVITDIVDQNRVREQVLACPAAPIWRRCAAARDAITAGGAAAWRPMLSWCQHCHYAAVQCDCSVLVDASRHDRPRDERTMTCSCSAAAPLLAAAGHSWRCHCTTHA